MIAHFLAWLRFKITPPIEFRYEFNSVRMSEDMPDFKSTMWIDKFGRCSSRGPILKLEGAELQSWNLTKTKNDLPNLTCTLSTLIFTDLCFIIAQRELQLSIHSISIAMWGLVDSSDQKRILLVVTISHPRSQF